MNYLKSKVNDWLGKRRNHAFQIYNPNGGNSLSSNWSSS